METVQFEIHPEHVPGAGFDFHHSRDVLLDLGASSFDLKYFQDFWNYLPTDPFMADGGNYRQRRFGVFHYTPGEGITFKGNEEFFQSKIVNQLNGGVARKFECVEPQFAKDQVLQSLLYWDLFQLPEYMRARKLKIYIHQIRIISNQSMRGNPTPEGIHQDGHLFVAQHLVNRQNVSGGISQIYDLDQFPVFSTTLSYPLDTLLVNDPMVFHSVSPIVCDGDSGFRDMLLVDFNFLEEI